MLEIGEGHNGLFLCVEGVMGIGKQVEAHHLTLTGLRKQEQYRIGPDVEEIKSLCLLIDSDGLEGFIRIPSVFLMPIQWAFSGPIQTLPSA